MVISLTVAVTALLAAVAVGALTSYLVLRNTKNGVKAQADAVTQRVEQKVDELKNHFDQNRPLP